MTFKTKTCIFVFLLLYFGYFDLLSLPGIEWRTRNTIYFAYFNLLSLPEIDNSFFSVFKYSCSLESTEVDDLERRLT